MDTQTRRFMWQNIEIEAVYDPLSYGGFAHLEIRSIRPEHAPLPVPKTGYRSHFHPRGTIEAHGGDVVAQVKTWLDCEAAKPEWRRYVEASRQGSLF